MDEQPTERATPLGIEGDQASHNSVCRRIEIGLGIRTQDADIPEVGCCRPGW